MEATASDCSYLGSLESVTAVVLPIKNWYSYIATMQATGIVTVLTLAPWAARQQFLHLQRFGANMKATACVTVFTLSP